jgi:predicted SprT family Zn-dependent metalloprotease
MNLAKQLFFNGVDRETTLRELTLLANVLLTTEFSVGSFKGNLAQLGWKFEFNTRKRSLGLCSSRRKTIYLSSWLAKQNLNKSSQLENTLRHELAHAIDFEIRGKSDHSYIWKNIAVSVLCSGDRCYSGEVITIKEETKYTLICVNCGGNFKKHKRPKRTSACAKCCNQHNGGRYSADYILEVKQNY